jgi:sugar/nucleoside kinase (ribokinase family)
MAEVVAIGDTLADISFDLPADFLHRSQQGQALSLPFGGKLAAKGYTLGPGGSGANVAVGLARAGVAATFVTGLSTDALGVFLKETLAGTGVRLRATEHDQPSNLSVVLHVKAERTIITARPDPYSYLAAELPKTGHIHVGPLPPDRDQFFAQLIQHVAKTSQTISLNPRKEALLERGRHLLIALPLLEILFVNQEEAAALARLPARTSPTELIRSLRRLGPKIVVVTAGEKGAFIGAAAGTYFVGVTSSRDNRVDATGAGDAFVSGFLAGYLGDSSEGERPALERGAIFAALNSGSVVTKIGAQNGLLTEAELEQASSSVTLKKVEEL